MKKQATKHVIWWIWRWVIESPCWLGQDSVKHWDNGHRGAGTQSDRQIGRLTNRQLCKQRHWCPPRSSSFQQDFARWVALQPCAMCHHYHKLQITNTTIPITGSHFGLLCIIALDHIARCVAEECLTVGLHVRDASRLTLVLQSAFHLLSGDFQDFMGTISADGVRRTSGGGGGPSASTLSRGRFKLDAFLMALRRHQWRMWEQQGHAQILSVGCFADLDLSPNPQQQDHLLRAWTWTWTNMSMSILHIHIHNPHSQTGQACLCLNPKRRETLWLL